MAFVVLRSSAHIAPRHGIFLPPSLVGPLRSPGSAFQKVLASSHPHHPVHPFLLAPEHP